MHPYHYAHTPIDLVDNPDLVALFDEITRLRSIKKEGWVLHFLQQAFHPMSPEKREPFNKKEFTTEYYLPIKIKNLKESEIYKLCIDIVRISRKIAMDDIDKFAVYTLLNKNITDTKNPKRRVKR
jgi:hypothetical protein